MFELPKEVADGMNKLNQLVKKYPDNIPIPEVIKFLGVDRDGFRTTLERNTCPFGIGWRKPGKDRMSGIVPTVTFYLWYTNTRGTG